MRRKLEKLEEENKEFDSELNEIRKAPELLTVKGGVIYPCIFIILGLVLSGTASYLSTIKDISVVIPLFIWILGLPALGYSIYRLCKSLKVIEDVAVTSEEAWIAKTVDAFKIAQKELELERRPEIVLRIADYKLPLQIPLSSELKIKLTVRLKRGEIAENASVFLAAPEGFGFLGEGVNKLPKGHEYENYVCIRWDVGILISGIENHYTITIKSPPEAGNYNIIYYIHCRGFRTEGQIPIKVK